MRELSEIINELEEIECTWCKAVIGRVRFDERQVVMDALCNSCIRDYEQSIVKTNRHG